MTIKFCKIFLLSTLVSYILLISVASDIGIIQYQSTKVNYSNEKTTNIQLKQEIDELKTYKEQLENGKYVNDLLFELGYVNTKDEVYVFNEDKNTEIYSNSTYEVNNNNTTEKKLFENWKNNQFIILSIVIGIAISVCYLLLSKKMEKNK